MSMHLKPMTPEEESGLRLALEALKAAQAYVCGPTAWTQEQEDTLVEAMSKAIARAEAALAEPDADGWIPWAGGKCPVPPDTLVDVKVKPRHEVMYRRFARNLEWSHDDPWCNHIDFYRIAGEEK